MSALALRKILSTNKFTDENMENQQRAVKVGKSKEVVIWRTANVLQQILHAD